MDTRHNTASQLSEQELLHDFESLVARDRRTTARLLVAIAEIDERKLWARHAFPSMFAFCVERFHMSEQVTTKRIWAARTARRFPVVLEMIERGELNLSAIHLLARHLTADNFGDVLQRARHKSFREIERLVAALAPRPDVASRVRALPRRVADSAPPGGGDASGDATARSESASIPASAAASRVEADSNLTSESPEPGAIRPRPNGTRVGGPILRPQAKPITALSPRRYKIEITVDEETHDKLRSLQDLLGCSQVGRDPAAIISRALDILLVETLKRKAATTDRPRAACDASATDDSSQTTCDASATDDEPQSASDASATDDRPQSASDASATNDRPQPARDASTGNPNPQPRRIPAALRREVWRRDCGRCRYTDGRGRRCNATSNVEFHHKRPFAMGGRHDAKNVELRCAAHNQYQADLDFGRDFMDARRTAGARN
jgi:5-methylcytosine-specific restriction endonuclease McrA